MFESAAGHALPVGKHKQMTKAPLTMDNMKYNYGTQVLT